MSFTANIDDVVAANRNGLLAAHPSWQRARLKDVATILNGYPFESARFSKQKGTPLIRIRDILPGKTETFYNGDFDPAFLVQPGEILVGMDGDFHCAAWSGGPSLLNQRVCKITPDETRYSKQLLRYVLPGYLSAINAETPSVTVKHLSSRTVADIPLPLPPLKEHRRIVGEIEKQFTRLEAGVAALRRVQANLKRYRAAVLKAACEGRLVPTGVKWKNATFSEIIESSFYGPRFGKESYSSVGVPTIRTTDITFDGSISLTDAPRIKLSDGETDKYRLIHGDIVLTRTGATIGKCAFYDESHGPAIPSAYLIRFRFKKELVNPKYVLRFLMSPAGQSLLVRGSTSVAQPNVNAATISKFIFPLPPLTEQTQIVAEVERRLSVVEELESVVSDNLARSLRLRQSILQKAFTGELV